MSTDAGAQTATEVRYQTETVKVIRGTERKTIAKRESEGWELVSQDTGTLRTELVFRRPKPKTDWRLFAILGGVLVVLGIFIAVMASLSGGADAEPDSKPPASQGSEQVDPRDEPTDEPDEPIATVSEETPVPDHSDAVVITVDELLDKLNSAGMGGIQTGDQFEVTGELFMSDLWMTGATGDYFVMLKAQGGAQDLTVFADESAAAEWSDGTTVEMILEAVDATIDGETSGGWLRVISAKTLS